MNVSHFFPFWVFLLMLSGCNSFEEKNAAENRSQKNDYSENIKARTISQEFKDYWYSGTAEITSYSLLQERYGELREGTAVNIL